jgi:hypothetical protein
VKGTGFEAVLSIEQTDERTEDDKEEAFSRAFDSLYERCERCAEARRGLH